MRLSENTACSIVKSGSPGSSKKKVLACVIHQACIGTGLFLLPTLPAIAQSSGDELSRGQVQEEVIVIGDQSEFRRDNSSVTKFTEPLRDTPQSITTLTSEFLDQRGVTTLEDALRTVPGITLGAGEFAWQGNNPNLRGFSSRNDMFLDGIRDFGSYARDPFNLERVEVLQGPSSMVFGRGSTGGVINQSNKKPLREEDLTAANVNIGTNSTLRGTVDISRPITSLGEDAAFRVNMMGHKSDIAGRDGGGAKRFGIAPSLAMGLGSATRLTLSYMKQVADDTPDYGLPWFGTVPADVPRENYYGFDDDYVDTNADIFTVELDHQLNDIIDLNSQFRYAHYTRDNRITEPLIDAGTPAGTSPADITIDRYIFFGDSTETMLFGQVGATFLFNTGDIGHALVTGVEIGKETSAPTFGFAIGVPGTNLLNPNQGAGFSATRLETRVEADTTAKSLAFYALDTIKFGDTIQLVTGVRWDKFSTDYDADRFAGTPTRFTGAGADTSESIEQTDKVVSYRAALVYKPVEYGTVYFGWGTSFNPSGETLSFVTSGRGLGTGNVTLSPEKNRSFEFGTKWELLDESLAVNGSIFRIEKTNARVPDPDNPGFNKLEGKQRVDGVSFNITGHPSEDLEVWAGYTYLDGKVVNSGFPKVDTPHHSLSTWVSYRLTPVLQFGGGARYLSKRLVTSGATPKSIDGYWALDAMGSYQLNDSLLLKLNVSNLTDKYYFSQIHPWHIVPGPGITATFAANFLF